MASAAAWLRRLSRDHQSSSSSNQNSNLNNDQDGSPTTECSPQVGINTRFSAISVSNNTASSASVYPHSSHQQTHHANKKGPPNSSRTFLNNLLNSSRRRFSLPVNDGDHEDLELPSTIQSA